ncbi:MULTISPECIES: NADPH-dependent FMN reductase [unclassified Massilia]|uniref:NADPH-dependent FMN reductase n=1 Tax=unclassified Massilia TaxID=2609279 RepID=UPI00178490C6|nr:MULTISPECIES: NADPH-dependent FMN reductase [unclassified Massilia]MBD8529689.1 NADPH-dependent FMN reductase [Massilia sp. CFBP 13647]MBD8673224.1 NADPH-dependent FMN reductase [Massilia sp. CFBP 13721]
MSVILLGGSPSPNASTTRLLLHVGDKLALHGQRLIRIEARELDPQALLAADCGEPGIARMLAQIAAADALVIATPVYKAAYSGLLKAVLDLLPQDGLAGKLVLPLASGGSQSHMLALDYALHPVLASMAPRSILPSIYATADQLGRNADGSLAPAPAIAARVAQGVEQLAFELRALELRTSELRATAHGAEAALAA